MKMMDQRLATYSDASSDPEVANQRPMDDGTVGQG